MKYLTQIHVGRTEAARRKICDLYAWHKMIWHAFPKKDGQMRKFLFRVDAETDSFRVLLLSPERPSLADWGTWQTKAISLGFLAHQVYLFQLKANPTMRRSSDRRRLPIYQENRLRLWMVRKAKDAGFRIADKSLIIGAPIDEHFTRKGRRGKHVSVDFQGLLNVTNQDRFRKAFCDGIGPAKAFGFGLLMLQPISSK
jgi:CRISPR system Cascade subunit CasE